MAVIDFLNLMLIRDNLLEIIYFKNAIYFDILSNYNGLYTLSLLINSFVPLYDRYVLMFYYISLPMQKIILCFGDCSLSYLSKFVWSMVTAERTKKPEYFPALTNKQASLHGYH